MFNNIIVRDLMNPAINNKMQSYLNLLNEEINTYSSFLSSAKADAEKTKEGLTQAQFTLQGTKSSWTGRIVLVLLTDNALCRALRRLFPCIENWPKQTQKLEFDVEVLNLSLKSNHTRIKMCVHKIKENQAKILLFRQQALTYEQKTLVGLLGKNLW